MTSQLSPLEVVWESLSSTKTVRTYKRFIRGHQTFFDYCIWNYEEANIGSFCGDELTEEWISKEFFNAILGTPEGRRDLVLTPPKDITFESVIISHPDLEIIARSMEDQIFHYDIIHNIHFTQKSEAANIIEILCHRELGEKNRTHIQIDEILNAINYARNNNQPLRIILPAFPFKDQNPFRTESVPSHIDLGEIIMLIRLYALIACLTEAIPSIGMELIITCDGVIYSDIFGVDRNEVIGYRERIRTYRNLLNLQRLIHILDVADIIKRFDNFDNIQSYIKDHLEKEITNNPIMKEQFLILTRGIKFNLNLCPYAEKYNLDFLGRCLNEDVNDEALSHEELDIRREINLKAKDAALKYISLHLAMKYLNIFGRVFPGALRATIHPKPGQIGIAKRGNVFPWNGVPLVSQAEEKDIWRNTEIMEFFRIYNRARRKTLQRVYLKEQSNPFYYKIVG
jgi:pyoverdine/dityrosine biosynthesis protein Dit1